MDEAHWFEVGEFGKNLLALMRGAGGQPEPAMAVWEILREGGFPAFGSGLCPQAIVEFRCAAPLSLDMVIRDELLKRITNAQASAGVAPASAACGMRVSDVIDLIAGG